MVETVGKCVQQIEKNKKLVQKLSSKVDAELNSEEIDAIAETTRENKISMGYMQ